MNIIFLKIGTFSKINLFLPRSISKHHNIVAEIDAHDAINPRKPGSLFYSFLNLLYSIFKFRSKWRLYYTSTPIAFKAMSKFCQKKLKNHDFDVVLQTQTFFRINTKKPYFIYKDYPPFFLKEKYPQLYPGNHEFLAYDSADKILVFNNEIKSRIVRTYNFSDDKIHVMGVGSNTDFIPDIKKNPDAKDILFVTSKGSFKIQRLDAVLKAFNNVIKEFPDVWLNIIGFKLKNNPKNVRSYGFLPIEKVLKFYDNSLIFLMPADIGGAQSVLEAMGKKCVCIVKKDNPILSSIIIHKKTGFLISDPDSDLAETIKLIYKSSNKKIQEQAFSHVVNNFTWDKVAENFNKVLGK